MDILDAIRERDLEALRSALARRDGDVPVEGISPLTLAAYLRFSDGVALLRQAHEPDAFEAAILGETDVCLDPLASIDQLSSDGFTALHLAAHFDHAALVRQLVARGASPDAVGAAPLSNRPLHAAAAGGAGDALATLLALGADVDARDGQRNTPLMVAAAGRHHALVEALLAAGGDPSLRNAAGLCAADMATERGYPELVQLLAQPS